MNIQNLETQYLKAKIAYYDGNPLMSDAAFDILEGELKDLGSKVVEQVGSKRKDFDFQHPNKMKSLGKFQMEDVEGITNYCETEFNQWLASRKSILAKHGTTLTYMFYGPKFDGSAINIIYRNGKLESVLTRGDGAFGKDASDRFRKHLPETFVYDGEMAEIRCEGVMAVKTFNEKYSKELGTGTYENARNTVAGIIGADDIDINMVADINLVPLHFLVDGKHRDISNIHFTHPIFASTEVELIGLHDYIPSVIKSIKARDLNKYPLDGIVFTLPFGVREILGENDHDPNWAIAIKFVSEEAVTTVVGIEWNLGKTGELTPVILLKPVRLAGTTVKRASGYNAGYIIKNRIQVGTILSVQKAGDIIPEVKQVIFSPAD